MVQAVARRAVTWTRSSARRLAVVAVAASLLAIPLGTSTAVAQGSADAGADTKAHSGIGCSEGY